jgi:hypothetical protein
MATNAHPSDTLSDTDRRIARTLTSGDLTATQRRTLRAGGDLVTLPFGFAGGRDARLGRGRLLLGADGEGAIHVLDVRPEAGARDDAAVVRVQAGGALQHVETLAPGRADDLRAWVQFVADRRGWATDAIAPEVLD